MKLRVTTMIGVVAAALAVATTGVIGQSPAPAAKEGGVDFSKAKLRNPAQLTEKAPAAYKASFDTSKGTFVVDVHRDWSPYGADRFYNLVKNGFYNDVRFFRVITGFMVQFGISGDPALSKSWMDARIADDPVKQSNKRGFISFATAGPNTRTTQVFINFADNAGLDKQGFSPFGQVDDAGMKIVDSLNAGYASGPQNDFMSIVKDGNTFLTKKYPKLDYVKKATIVK